MLYNVLSGMTLIDPVIKKTAITFIKPSARTRLPFVHLKILHKIFDQRFVCPLNKGPSYKVFSLPTFIFGFPQNLTFFSNFFKIIVKIKKFTSFFVSFSIAFIVDLIF